MYSIYHISLLIPSYSLLLWPDCWFHYSSLIYISCYTIVLSQTSVIISVSDTVHNGTVEPSWIRHSDDQYTVPGPEGITSDYSTCFVNSYFLFPPFPSLISDGGFLMLPLLICFLISNHSIIHSNHFLTSLSSIFYATWHLIYTNIVPYNTHSPGIQHE